MRRDVQLVHAVSAFLNTALTTVNLDILTEYVVL